MKKSLQMIISSLALFACAQSPIHSPTTSGKPERLFTNQSRDTVKQKIASRCMSKGSSIYEDTPIILVCGKTADSTNALFSQYFLTGNTNANPPIIKVKFTLLEQGKNVMVYAEQFVEFNLANGNKQITQVNSPSVINMNQAALNQIE